MIAPLLMAAPDPVVPTGSDAQLILAALGALVLRFLHFYPSHQKALAVG